MHQIPVRRSKHRVGSTPLEPEFVQHRACIVHGVRPRLSNLPNVDVRGLQRDQVVEFVAVNLIDTGEHTQGPIDGAVAVCKGVVRVVVNVEPDFHALRNQAALAVHLRTVDGLLAVFDGARKSILRHAFVDVKEEVFDFHLRALMCIA